MYRFDLFQSVFLGTKSIWAGLRHLVDRKDRRDLSLFQIGLQLIERKLLRQLSVSTLPCYLLEL